MVAVTTGITLPAQLDARPAIEFEMTSPFTKGFVRKEFTLYNTDVLNIAQIGAGVNMAVRRSALGDTGLFDESLDGGTPTVSGGDHEFFHRAITRGYRIAYDPSAIVWHNHRVTASEAIRTVYGYGVGVLSWWTRSLIQEREYAVLLRAPICILQYHAKRVVDSLLGKRGSPPLQYSIAELRGALYGPIAYLKSLAGMSD
jgi:GT2 family glycosyltransferase